MKINYLLILLLMLSIELFAQNYPEVTIKDINFVPNDSLLFYASKNTEPKSLLVGDTVIITGVVMNSPYFNADPANAEMLAAGAPSVFLQDQNNLLNGAVFYLEILL